MTLFEHPTACLIKNGYQGALNGVQGLGYWTLGSSYLNKFFYLINNSFYENLKNPKYSPGGPKMEGIWREAEGCLEVIYGTSKWFVGCLDVSKGQVRTGQFRTGQVRTCQFKTG